MLRSSEKAVELGPLSLAHFAISQFIRLVKGAYGLSSELSTLEPYVLKDVDLAGPADFGSPALESGK